MGRGPGDGAEDWVTTARELYLAAAAVFLVTVAIGLPNGMDAFDPSRDLLLAHVHSGTLGWLSLGIAATATWMLRAADRRLSIALMVLVPVYVVAFVSGSLSFKAVTGLALLVAIAWLVFWAWRAYLAADRTLPRLAVVLALTTFAYGAVIGVVLQVQFAAGVALLSGDAIGSHAGAMVFAYLILAAMGIIEWRLAGTTGLPRSGLIQVAALFAGGVVLSLGLLVGAAQAAGGLYLLVTLVAIVLFGVRVLPLAVRVRWGEDAPARSVAAAALWVVVAVVIYLYLVASFVASGGDTAAVSRNILVASDHATFVGVMTSLLLGLMAAVVPGRRVGPPWAGHLQFWAMQSGLAVFVVGLALDLADVKRAGAPVMGLAVLLGLALRAPPLWRARRDPSPPG